MFNTDVGFPPSNVSAGLPRVLLLKKVMVPWQLCSQMISINGKLNVITHLVLGWSPCFSCSDLIVAEIEVGIPGLQEWRHQRAGVNALSSCEPLLSY